MNKVLWGLSLLLLGSFLEAKPLFSEYKTSLLEANDKGGVIADSSEFVVGSSGVVIHRFDAKTASIIARFDVVSKANGKATLRFDTFKMLSQGAFPDTGLKPSAGDDIVVNYLYDRALIIVPNQETYTTVTKAYKEIAWVHPDLVSGYLAKLYRPNPDQTIFQNACYQNSASLIFFGIATKGYFVDCHNFNTLHTIDIKEGTEMQVPFYSRVKNVETSWFSWGSLQIADYKTYYSALIRK